MAALAYSPQNLRLPLDLELCAKLLSIGGVWLFLRQWDSIPYTPLLFGGIVAAATVQAGLALLQKCDVLSSSHAYLSVTESFGNPAPLGCYAGMALVGVWISRDQQSKHSTLQASVHWCCLLILAAGMIMADSRAAWLAAGLAIGLFHLRTCSRKRLVLAVLPALCLGVATALYAYRPASVHARTGVWQVCGTMVGDHPLVGCGTGRFTTAYMPKQAQMLETASEEERRQADDVETAYNEPLQTLCEQGLVGLLLWGGFVLAVGRELWQAVRRNEGVPLFYPVMVYLMEAETDHFQVDGLQSGQLYWLRPKDESGEELPFLTENEEVAISLPEVSHPKAQAFGRNCLSLQV